MNDNVKWRCEVWRPWPFINRNMSKVFKKKRCGNQYYYEIVDKGLYEHTADCKCGKDWEDRIVYITCGRTNSRTDRPGNKDMICGIIQTKGKKVGLSDARRMVFCCAQVYPLNRRLCPKLERSSEQKFVYVNQNGPYKNVDEVVSVNEAINV